MRECKSLLDALQRARERRQSICEAGTSAFRVADGAADGLPGIEIDEFAAHWLVQTRDAARFPDWLRDANPAGALYWKPLGEKQPPRHVSGPRLTAPFHATENGLSFEIDFASGYSQGLFIDQRDNRSKLRALSNGRSILNCFAYTCAFGVAGAAGGAQTTNLDLSKSYLERGRRNYRLNGFDPDSHDFIFGDVGDWLGRFARKKRRFDIIVLDPPTFSRNDRGKVFTIERDFAAVVSAACPVLQDGGMLFCSTNQRTLSPSGFRRLITSGLPAGSNAQFESGSMPADFPGEPYLKSFFVHPHARE